MLDLELKLKCNHVLYMGMYCWDQLGNRYKVPTLLRTTYHVKGDYEGELSCSFLGNRYGTVCSDQAGKLHKATTQTTYRENTAYKTEVMNHIEYHIEEYNIQDCIEQLDADEALTFILKDIAANSWLNYHGITHEMLVSEYCPTEATAQCN